MAVHFSSDAVQTYRRLATYVRPHWVVVAAAGIAAMVHAGADASIPLMMEVIIGRLRGESEGGMWTNHIPLVIVLVFLVRGVMDLLTVYGLSWVGRSVIRELRMELFSHLLSLPSRYFDKSSSGVLLSKLTYNTEQVAEAITTAVVVLLRDTLRIIVIIAVMIYLSWQLSVLAGIVAPVVGFLIAQMSRAFRRYSSRIQNSMGDATRIAEQSLQGQRVIKIFEGQAQETANFDKVNRWNFRLNLRLVTTRALGDSLTQLAVALGFAAIVYVAFSESLSASMSPELFVAFVTAMGMVLAPLKRVINVNVALQKGIAAGESLFEALDQRTEIDEGTISIDRAKGDVAYRGVSFSYDAAKGKVLHDIEFSVPAGTTVAIVGRSGSGKSSLVSLLPRFYDVDSGRVELDGVDVRDYRLADLRRQISIVTQEVVLFDDTIENNIAYGALRGSSEAEVLAAAEAAHVTDFAKDFPDGLKSQVGERGALLSGGQRQRIAIARALLKNAPVLVLDEATSALDTESERRIQSALEHLMKGRTTLVIAHRLSTIENADLILVLDNGVLVEMGSHRELLGLDGYYSALYRMQFAE